MIDPIVRTHQASGAIPARLAIGGCLMPDDYNAFPVVSPFVAWTTVVGGHQTVEAGTLSGGATAGVPPPLPQQHQQQPQQQPFVTAGELSC